MFSNTSTNLFGTPNTNNTAGGLFGSATKTTPNILFGSSTQQTALGTTPSSTGLFSSMSNTKQLPNQSGLGGFGFGTSQQSNTGIFGMASQQNTGNSLFGSTMNQSTGSSVFSTTQQNSGNLFNQGSAPSLGSFGSNAQATTGGLFGSAPQQSTGMNLFGSSTGKLNLFGGSTTTFGGAPVAKQVIGTKGLQVVNRLHADSGEQIQSITHLPEVNQTKCIEELRYEDYVAGNTTTAPSIFGASTTTAPLASKFQTQVSTPSSTVGNFSTQTTTHPSVGLFGSIQPTPTSAAGSIFGQSPAPAPSPFAQQPGSLFGGFGAAPTPTASTTGGLFGSSAANLTTADANKTTTPFGMKTPSLFGGSTPQQNTTSLFGGSTLFPSTTTTATVSGFGSSLTAMQPTAPLGTNAPATTGLFGPGVSSTTCFSQPTATTNSFGFSTGAQPLAQTLTPGVLFGGTSLKASEPSPSIFGSAQPTLGGGRSTTTDFSNAALKPTSSLFGTSTPTTHAATTSLFQNPSTGLPLSSNMFGSSLGGVNSNKGLTTSLFSGAQQAALGTQVPFDKLGTSQLMGNTLTTSAKPSLFTTPNSGSLFGQPSILGSTQPTQGLFGTTQGQMTNGVTVGQGLPGVPNPTATGAQTVLRTQDPYGLGRVTPLLEKRYFLRGTLPVVPNPFSFPACGVILPTQYRRNKSNALAQLWQSAPMTVDAVGKHSVRNTSLKLTPRQGVNSESKMTRTPMVLGVDYGWPEHSVEELLKSTKKISNSEASISANRSKYSANHTSRSGSIFRLPMSHYSTTPKRGACSPRDPTAFTRDISSTYRKTQEHGSNSNPCTTGRTVHPHHTAGSFKEERDFAPSVGHTTDVRHTAAKCENYLHDTTNPPWLGRSAVTRQQHSNRVATPLTGATSTGYPTERNSARCGLNHVTRRTGRASELISDSPKPEAPCSSVFPKCTRAEYATHPSLEALQYYSENRLAVVEDFTVIREGYGEIKWPGLTDIRGLSIDDDVLIEDRAVEVYPSNGEKACIPVGRGLNKPALVTLYNCKPKTSGEGLSAEQEAELHRQHVEKVRWFTEKMGAQFIALTPEWVWKFRVEHFSRYAFEDQDSDESLPSARNTALSTTKSNNTTLLCSLPTDSIGIIKPKDIDYDALVDIFFERYTEMKSSKASFTATKHLEASLVSRCHFDIHQRREEGHEVLGKPYNHFHSIYLKYINELLEITFRLFQHEENAERLLLLQLECTVNFITSTQDVVVHPKMRQFLKYLEDTWRLAYILFGTIDDTEDETHSPQATQDKYRSAERIPWGEQKPTLPPLNDAQDETHVAETFLHGRELCKLRLHLVSEWFAQVNRQTVLTHLEALEGVKKEGINQKTLLPFEAENRLEKVFYRLMGNQIKEAVNDLIPPKASSSVCFFRLALCLVGSASPSLFSVPSNRQHLFQLLLEWQKYNIYDRIPLPILRIHHILAGCIDRLVASKTPDWRTLFALLLWYPSLDASLYIKTKTSAVSIDPHDMFGDNVYGTQQKIQTSHSLHRALYVYSEQLLKIPHQTSTPAPLPQYMGVVRRDILTNDPLDLHFSLLKLFCNGIFDFPKIFHPVCVGHQPHSIILLWPLFQAFKCILKVDCNQQHSTLTQFELYLDELFFQYLQSVGLWKWCILLLINQVSQTRVPELNAICRLTDVLMKCTPSPLLRSNVAQYLFYTEYVNFLVSAPIGLPPFLISYVQAIRYRSDHLHVQAADLWLECAVSSLENKDEDNTPLSQKQCAPSAFKKAFPHGLPFSACPSPTSFFYNSILDLLMSRDFMIKIQKLCSLLEGHAHFLWDALRLNGVGEFATHKSTIKIFKHLLHDVELLFVQNVPQQRLHHHYYKLLTRSFLELSRDITRKSHLFLFPKEWEKCVIMPLCQFVIWSIDVLMLFSRVADEEHYVEQDRDLQTSSSTTQHESSSRPFQDTLFQLSMKQLTDTVHHLHTIVTHQLQSCVPKPYKRDVTCRSRILPFIGNNLQRTSHLPSPLCSFELLSEEAFKVMACVAICLNSILNGGSSPSGTASFDQTMLNDMDKLNDYGYGILLAS